MRQIWTRAPRPRSFLVVAALSVITLAASSPIDSAVLGSHVIRSTSARLGFAAGVALDSKGTVYIADMNNERVRGVDKAVPQGSSYRAYRLRWPSSPNQGATYHPRFKSPHLRAMSLRVYGIAVPRGFGFDFIVACEHRGPAVLSWNWAQAGGYVRITVKMTSGTCDPPGPTVAGKYVTLGFRLVT